MKKILLKIFLFFSSIYIYLTQNDNNQEKKFLDITIIDEIENSIHIKSKDQMSRILNETDSTYLVYYYTKLSNNSIVGGVYLQRIDRKLDYISKIMFVDCLEVEPEDFSSCSIDKKIEGDYFPRIRLLIPNRIKFDEKKNIIPHTEIGFNKGYVSDTTLFEFISENVISYSVRLNSKNFGYLEKQSFFNKIILFTEKDSTPLIYRGLSNYFYDRILFGEVGKNETSLVEKFNITTFPTIIAIENNFFVKEDYKVIKYEGMVFIKDLKNFIEKFAYKEKHYMVRLSENKDIYNKYNFLNKISYDDFFEENKNEMKIVYFHEEEQDFNDEFSVPEHLKDLAEISRCVLFFIKNQRVF